MSVRDLDPLVLSDGRRLTLCEVGDPNGRVAFYFHGTGSSRLETALFAGAAQEHGVRLVGWDRPGAGGSTNRPGRTLLDVVADTRAVATHLEVGAVPVAGLSGGGSHVVALAAAGAGPVSRAVAVNPGAPADDEMLEVLSPSIGRFTALARNRPRAFAPVSQVMQYRGRGRVAEVLERVRRRQLRPHRS